MTRAFVVILCGLCACLVAPCDSFAGGTEWSGRAHDLNVFVDARWAGAAHGGYYPLRIRLTNTARPRNLLFRYANAGSGGEKPPTVERWTTVEQNATQQFTLSVPLANTGTFGEFQILEEGRELKEFSRTLTLPEPHRGGTDRPALLVISPSLVDCARFEDAVNSVTMAAGAGAASSPFGRYYGSHRTDDHQVVPPTLLPENWIDYTGLDVVAVPLATFGRLTPGARAAIVKWTEAGGTLVIYEVGGPAADSKDLTLLLGLADRRAGSAAWQPAVPSERKPVTFVDPQNGSMTTPMGVVRTASPPGTSPRPGAPQNGAAADPTALANKPVWPAAAGAFSRRDLMLGRVYAFGGNPFPGSAIDWAWWLNSVGQPAWSWVARHGLSSRASHDEFLEFLIPGVGGVPVFAFLTLITLFTIVIGPLNYWLLARRKQLYLLVVTIPAIAVATSCSLLGYAMIADGFGVQSRLRSFTLLDQQSKTAVSVNRIALYAGLAPSAGLSFSNETAVLPVWPNDAGLESGRLDWTNTQHLASGWLRSRTMAQFETIAHRVERGRIEVKPAAGGANRLDVDNGLEWDIDTLLLKNDAGKLFWGKQLPAGASTQLRPADLKDVTAVQRLLKEEAPKLPDGVTPGSGSGLFDFGYRRAMRMYSSQVPVKFADSLLEQNFKRIDKVNQDVRDGGLPPRTYLAIFKQNPGIELGLDRTRSKGGIHVVLGYY